MAWKKWPNNDLEVPPLLLICHSQQETYSGYLFGKLGLVTYWAVELAVKECPPLHAVPTVNN